MTRMNALVLGASGMVGGAICRQLIAEGHTVTGVSRRPLRTDLPIHHVSMDMLDPADCRAKAAELSHITHVFYAGRAPHGEGGNESVEDNLAMLVNAVEAISAAAPGLKHVNLVHGTKYYGNHLGAYKTPAEEDDPRAPVPNFYFDQQDWISALDVPWSWSAVRPPLVFGFTPGKARNLVSVLAAYAAIMKELGRPFSFPGTETAFDCLAECAHSDHLARAIVWMAGAPEAANQAFNITNGDIFRWRYMWQHFAAYFGMEAGPPLGISLAETMAEHEPVWDRIVEKHGLAPTPYRDIALWPYADYVFAPTWDIVSDTTKARLAGFHQVLKSEQMFFDLFDQYRAARLVP
ncbi:MAG: SDR family oxidoreductase [Nisaea sp.]|uniref:SDR family oxidoreductase n=1 Tax=Nisaea sp. TaxID=2024842 RepID=UPI001B1AC5CB|nr:SDR family oxidoreductase [Nisaea sp.]MBO6562504.1 SDR family oxidoreductase [Nisaea sp.]